MKVRYEVRRGRFGAYFFDIEANKEMDLAETVSTLNVLYFEGKTSNQPEPQESNDKLKEAVKLLSKVVGKLDLHGIAQELSEEVDEFIDKINLT